MNIIEQVREALSHFPSISELTGTVHIDFADPKPKSYGLSPDGDSTIKTDVLGNETRQHFFTLYTMYQSINDYDRLANQGTLLNLKTYLESYEDKRELQEEVDGVTYTGVLEKITCSNGMAMTIPNAEMNGGVQYTMKIIAQYKMRR